MAALGSTSRTIAVVRAHKLYWWRGESQLLRGYPLVMTNIAMEAMAHRNRWFTELKNGDFPWLC